MTDGDSLFEKGGTTTLTQERVNALHAEAAAYDEMIAKKREYYGIKDPIKDAYDELEKANTFIKDRVNKQLSPPVLERAETPQSGLEELESYRDNLQGLFDGIGQTNDRLKGELEQTINQLNQLIQTQQRVVATANRIDEVNIFQEDADSLFNNFDLDKSQSEYDKLFASVENGSKTAEQALIELGKTFEMVYNSAEHDWSISPQKRANDTIQSIAESLRRGEDGVYRTKDAQYFAQKAQNGYDVKSAVDGLQTHVKTLNEAKQAIGKMINDSFSSVEQNINSDLNAGIINAEQAADRLASVKAFVLEVYGDMRSAMGDKNGEFLIQQIQSGKLSYDDAFNLYGTGTIEEYKKQVEYIESIKSNIKELLSQGVGTKGQGEFQIEVLTGFLNDLSTNLGLTDDEVKDLKDEIEKRIAHIRQTMDDLSKESPSSTLKKFTPKSKSDVAPISKQEEKVETDPIKQELQGQIDYIKSDIEMAKKAILSKDPDGLLNSIFYGPDGKLKNIDFQKTLNFEQLYQSMYGDQALADKLSKLPSGLIDLYQDLYDYQWRLDELQKNGLTYLQEEADIRQEISSIQKTDYDKQLDAHTLQISDDDAAAQLATLEQTSERIDAIKDRAQKLEATQPFMIADMEDLNAQLSGLDAIKSKIEANIEALRTYKDVQIEDQYGIWMDFVDKYSNYDSGEQEKKLSRLQHEIDEQTYSGKMSGQQAIEQFKEQAKELGYVLDEVAGKWEKVQIQSKDNIYNFPSDIKSLDGYSAANQDFVDQLIVSVINGQKEYDAAMEELRSHIAQRQDEIRAEQEKNLRTNTELIKFASGSKPILEFSFLSAHLLLLSAAAFNFPISLRCLTFSAC